MKIKVDERLIETRRLEAIQRDMQELVRLTGQNRLTEAEFGTKVEELHASLEEWQRDQEQQRQMAQLELGARSDTVQSVIAAVAQIAGAGMNPAAAVTQIRDLLSDLGPQQDAEPAPEATMPQLTAASRIEEERRLLSEKRAALGISEMVINADPANPEIPGNAHLVCGQYTLFITCDPGYPKIAPRVQVEMNDGQSLAVAVPWQPNGHLIQAVTATIMQIGAVGQPEPEEER
jgi:hypothetical protein